MSALVIGIPLAGSAIDYLFFERGDAVLAFGIILGVPAISIFIWASLAFCSRARKGRNAGFRTLDFVHELIVAIFVLAIALGAIMSVIKWASEHTGFYILPTGLFALGMLMLVRSMTPPRSIVR